MPLPGAPPPPPGVPPPPQYYGPVSNPEADKMATWALVCAIGGFCCCGIILGPIAIILGYKAKNEGSTAGTATAAIVLGIIATVMFVIAVILQLTMGLLGQYMPSGGGL